MRKFMILALGVAMCGCASNNSLYEWGSYQPALVNYTKDSDAPRFEAELRDSIAKAEAKDRVPPGLYAELGYLLYQRGEAVEAATFFGREREAFPESATLMSKLIEGAGGVQ